MVKPAAGAGVERSNRRSIGPGSVYKVLWAMSRGILLPSAQGNAKEVVDQAANQFANYLNRQNQSFQQTKGLCGLQRVQCIFPVYQPTADRPVKLCVRIRGPWLANGSGSWEALTASIAGEELLGWIPKLRVGARLTLSANRCRHCEPTVRLWSEIGCMYLVEGMAQPIAMMSGL